MADAPAEMITQAASAAPGTSTWMLAILVTAISVLWIYIAKRQQEERQDRKAEREALVTILKDNAALIRENVQAFSRFEKVIERLERTLDTYMHQER